MYAKPMARRMLTTEKVARTISMGFIFLPFGWGRFSLPLYVSILYWVGVGVQVLWGFSGTGWGGRLPADAG